MQDPALAPRWRHLLVLLDGMDAPVFVMCMQTQQGVVVGADVDGLAMPRLTEWLKALGFSLPSCL